MSEAELILADEEPQLEQIKQALSAQHAIHGMMGRVFERLGGEDFMFEWAQDNPGRFLGMLVKATPGLAPTQGLQGDVHLHVHNTLGPSELDGE